MSRLFAGNVLTQILGDFGAEVIKVEPPAGDTLRAWQTEGVSTHWKVYGRNKKSLCLDLHKPRARELAARARGDGADMLHRELPPGCPREAWAWVRTCCWRAIRAWSSCASRAGARTAPITSAPASAR